MDVAVSDLRAHLSDWLGRARAGDEIVVTDHGVPVARLVGIEAATTLERLVSSGVIARPVRPVRPRAAGIDRPRTRRPLSELIDEQRR
jgi:prevent-host-death family protein